MDISIQQYRSRIGRFLPQTYSTSYSLAKNEDQPTNFLRIRTYLSTKLLILAPVLFSIVVLTPIHSSAQTYSHPLYPALPGYSNLLQNTYKSTNTRSGTTTTAIAAIYLLQYTINTLASSTFSMISNFESRYKNGNRIRMAHASTHGAR